MGFMRPVRSSREQRVRFDRKVGRALCCLLGLILVVGTAGAQTPAGTQIVAWAEVTYDAPNGLRYTEYSQSVVMTVAQAAGVDLEPPRSTVGDPGTTVVFRHTVTNVGNGPDSMALTAVSRRGWPVRVYRDANSDGALDPLDPPVSGPIPLAMGDSAALLVTVDVPASATVRGVADTVDLRVTCSFDASAWDALQDLLSVRDVGILVTISKAVDRAVATTGDVLTYTLSYTAVGSATADNVEIKDLIPVGTAYLPGTLQWNGAPLTDAVGDDVGFFDVGGNRVVFRLGALTGGNSGTVSFQVRVTS